MITAFRLIFAPNETWAAIAYTGRGMLSVWFRFILPVSLVCCGAEAAALHYWGHDTGMFGGRTAVSVDLALRYGLVYFALCTLQVVVGAKLIQWVEFSFNTRFPYGPTFVAVAYSLGPVFLSRLLDAVPALPTWGCWGVGMLVSWGALYHGLPRILRTDHSAGFGLYLFAAVVLGAVSGIAHMAALSVLNGTIRF